MRLRLIFFFSMLLSTAMMAQEQPQWLRYPVISPDGQTIVFAYKSDLYRVAAEGGMATQLTFHEAHDYYARWSKDGQALTTDRDMASFLNRKAGEYTLLEVVNPQNNERKQITVKPISLGAEKSLLYDRWVKRNAKEVGGEPTSRWTKPTLALFNESM